MTDEGRFEKIADRHETLAQIAEILQSDLRQLAKRRSQVVAIVAIMRSDGSQ